MLCSKEGKRGPLKAMLPPKQLRSTHRTKLVERPPESDAKLKTSRRSNGTFVVLNKHNSFTTTCPQWEMPFFLYLSRRKLLLDVKEQCGSNIKSKIILEFNQMIENLSFLQTGWLTNLEFYVSIGHWCFWDYSTPLYPMTQWTGLSLNDPRSCFLTMFESVLGIFALQVSLLRLEPYCCPFTPTNIGATRYKRQHYGSESESVFNEARSRVEKLWPCNHSKKGISSPASCEGKKIWNFLEPRSTEHVLSQIES